MFTKLAHGSSQGLEEQGFPGDPSLAHGFQLFHPRPHDGFVHTIWQVFLKQLLVPLVGTLGAVCLGLWKGPESAPASMSWGPRSCRETQQCLHEPERPS